ncbi:MAG: hypothetical protein ABI906_05195, partial [Pseudomonadota bacterium]
MFSLPPLGEVPAKPGKGALLPLLFSCTLAACTTVGPNFSRPAPPAAANFAMGGDPRPAGVTLTADSRPAVPWWRALGSPALDAVMGEA